MQIRKYFIRFWPLYLLAALICTAGAWAGSRAVTTIAENSPIVPSRVVIIDAGHGGEDGGATSCTGVPESEINLQIALRLETLCHLLGIHTVMIRTTDISVYTQGRSLSEKKMSDLKERVRIVNQAENAILVSIHQNTFADSQYAGAQVFYATTDDSKQLAEQMQTALVKNLNIGSNRKCKQANGIYLMQHIQRPGILIECGFLSNPTEESLLRDDVYQKKLCSIIATELSKYINA